MFLMTSGSAQSHTSSLLICISFHTPRVKKWFAFTNHDIIEESEPLRDHIQYCALASVKFTVRSGCSL